MEGIVEDCLGFLYDLLMVICVGLLLRVAVGRSGRWVVLLVVSGVMLSCLVHSSVLKVGLMSVLCSVVHYVGREEVMLSTLDKAVLITGCDSGFGHDLARFLDGAGMRVFAGVLNELSPGALKLKKAASPNLTILQLDITNSSQITQAYQDIKSQTGKAGEVPLPGFAGYGASKAAMIVYNGAIRQELYRWGVRVIIIQPGAFKTNIFGSREQWNSVQEDILSGLSQEVMTSYGEEYIRSMQQRLANMSSASRSDTGPFLEDLKHAILSPRPKHFYYPGAAAWALPLLYRHCPTSLSDRILSPIFMTGDAQPAQLGGS
ncbi:estradiol 17-beta-dehydrogenase 2 isoform X2 [Rhinichthys klamathensis goyatoka]|uniref:estradiol 17-beta-dehydrogenase 2 isoform X2 n=1 Tax=Rhinichthys klamathensis goyatoka TaxID=3034132 RepID=UPI0024B62BF3|nr:estradiol 17-beta-dehydrogenase 2 isoform X2 [Rhinichthys klamathensis goyatoka]